ncbi:ABC-2 transporter permease [Alkalihalobacillus sp. NPDC078783]
MKGLLLNQYYAVEKSFWVYLIIGLVFAVGLVVIDNSAVQRVAVLLPFSFMASAAIEVLKHESTSGWSKYVLTLPVRRERVVQSHYLFFTLVSSVGLFIVGIQFLLSQFLFGITLNPGYIYSIMNALGLVFILGFITYPLTYILGTEKAEAIMMVGVGVGIGVFFLSSLLYELVFISVQSINLDLMFSLSFILITLILFIISYIVSIQVYKRKEF